MLKNKPKNNSKAIVMIAIAIVILVLSRVLPLPEGLTREEAALYVAIAKVCPKSDNHSKAEYLTFAISGWSFDKLPDAVLEYVTLYSAGGGATLLQFDHDTLVNMGYITKGEADSFYEDDMEVYADGKGKLFTFTLKEGENTDNDVVTIGVEGFISTHDDSGYDVVLSYRNGTWEFARFENTWNAYDFETEDPNATRDPIK